MFIQDQNLPLEFNHLKDNILNADSNEQNIILEYRNSNRKSY